MIKKRCFAFYILLAVCILLISGCAGTVKHMNTVDPEQVIAEPEHGKAIIVFLRPSGSAYGVQSSVFELVDNKPKIVGIVAAKKKVAYQLEPGNHSFMVIGENADFMTVNLAANKIYYVVINPRMGWWKARFSFRPVHVEQLDSPQLKQWLAGCKWVVKTSESDLWADNNMPSILSKYHKYYGDWINKSWVNRPKLQLQDGKPLLASKKPPIVTNTEALKKFYSPQNAVDSFDDGEYEYYSPQEINND